MKIITVANAKGGVGKSTTAICTAQELRRRGYRVLFIDTDAQCNSTAFYEVETDGVNTFMDILCGDEPASECIQHTEKGDIIAGDPLLAGAETKVDIDERRFTHLKRSLRDIKDNYDFCIIDTPPSIGVALKNVLAAADYIIIPAEENGWSLTGLIDFAKAIDLAKDNNEKLNVLGIVFVKAKRTRKAVRMSEYAKTVADHLHTSVFTTKIRESVTCSEALNEYCVPIYEYAPKSTTNADYTDFVTEMLKRIED